MFAQVKKTLFSVLCREFVFTSDLVPVPGAVIYACLLVFICAENRENSFSRSRSSSVSSIDRDSKEAITALYFMESFARKNDSAVSSCLWVGTGLGMVIILSLNLPASDDLRQSEPVVVSPSGECAALFLLFICLGAITAWFCTAFWAEMSQKSSSGHTLSGGHTGKDAQEGPTTSWTETLWLC